MEENTLVEKISKLILDYRFEWFFLLLAFTGVIISSWFFMTVYKESSEGKIKVAKDIKETESKKFKIENGGRIFIDVSGAVKKPGLYELSYNSRIKNALEKAQGFSDEADVDFFYRNYNLARLLSDQEKIYVPSKEEIERGIFVEGVYTIGSSSVTTQSINKEKTSTERKININMAERSELESLPGVGTATADKIIQNRPFELVNELLDKKIVNNKTYEDIRSLIEL